MTVCPRPLTLASSLRMGPRGQKVLLRYACKKNLDMHVYSQGAAADGEVAADDARAGSGGGGARARLSWTLICWCAEALCSELRLWREPRLRGVSPAARFQSMCIQERQGHAAAGISELQTDSRLCGVAAWHTLNVSRPSTVDGQRANCGGELRWWLLEACTDAMLRGTILWRAGWRDEHGTQA